MAWIYLLIAGLVEVAWAIGLKYTESWTKLYPSRFTIASMVASFYFLSLAVNVLLMGTAYALWTGIGAVGAALLGIVLFGESRELARRLCIGLILAGITGLKLTAPA